MQISLIVASPPFLTHPILYGFGWGSIFKFRMVTSFHKVFTASAIDYDITTLPLIVHLVLNRLWDWGFVYSLGANEDSLYNARNSIPIIGFYEFCFLFFFIIFTYRIALLISLCYSLPLRTIVGQVARLASSKTRPRRRPSVGVLALSFAYIFFLLGYILIVNVFTFFCN